MNRQNPSQREGQCKEDATPEPLRSDLHLGIGVRLHLPQGASRHHYRCVERVLLCRRLVSVPGDVVQGRG